MEQEIELKKLEIPNREQTITYISNIKQVIDPSQMKFKYSEKHDLIKNIYEGGFKVWECTIDMLNYLDKKIKAKELQLEGKSIMDVGCGHGLLGIYGLQEKASLVNFTDYNVEVLDMVTQKNIAYNLEKQDNVVFLSGDWNDLPQKIEQQQNEFKNNEQQNCQNYAKKYDIILMSEVIYHVENYKKITDLMVNLLDKNGICLLANKLFYFGCGGSMPEYKDFLQQNYSEILQWETAEFINNKKGNKREILAVKFKNN